MTLSKELQKRLTDAGLPPLEKPYSYDVSYDVVSNKVEVRVREVVDHGGFSTQPTVGYAAMNITRGHKAANVVVDLGKSAYNQAFPDEERDFKPFLGGPFTVEKPSFAGSVEDRAVSGTRITADKGTNYILINLPQEQVKNQDVILQIDGREIAKVVRGHERGIR